MRILYILATMLCGLAVCIPLTVRLVLVTKDAVLCKRWDKLLKLIPAYIIEAEKLFDNGADREVWVLSVVRKAAADIGYPITEADVSRVRQFIDQLVFMAKCVNVSRVEGDANEL